MLSVISSKSWTFIKYSHLNVIKWHLNVTYINWLYKPASIPYLLLEFRMLRFHKTSDLFAAPARGQQQLHQLPQTQNCLVCHELFPHDVPLGSICRKEIDEVEAEIQASKWINPLEHNDRGQSEGKRFTCTSFPYVHVNSFNHRHYVDRSLKAAKWGRKGQL